MSLLESSLSVSQAAALKYGKGLSAVVNYQANFAGAQLVQTFCTFSEMV